MSSVNVHITVTLHMCSCRCDWTSWWSSRSSCWGRVRRQWRGGRPSSCAGRPWHTAPTNRPRRGNWNASRRVSSAGSRTPTRWETCVLHSCMYLRHTGHLTLTQNVCLQHVMESEQVIRELQESQVSVSDRLAQQRQQLTELCSSIYILDPDFISLQDTKDRVRSTYCTVCCITTQRSNTSHRVMSACSSRLLWLHVWLTFCC